jgi:RNA polymerase sigma factor (sigma-70 family)
LPNKNKFLPAVIKYNEHELVSLLKAKDEKAFAYLYDNYSAAINGVIYRMVEDRELGEELLQTTFVKIWKNMAYYEETKGRLFTWMVNIARNLTIDTLRSKSYRQQQQISNDENAVSNIRDEKYGTEKFDAMGIRNQLANLKPEQRNIIDLAYFNGYTQDEISKETGIPLGTVKTRMRTAILELRKLLENK